jgi:hypothetical protein
MTVTSDLIKSANRSLSTTEAGDALTAYGTVASSMMALDDPPAALYDWCHALMICHLLASSDPETGLKSFTSGDLSATRDPGDTIWLIEYRRIIESGQTTESSDESDGAVIRADAYLPDLGLDQETVDIIYEGD